MGTFTYETTKHMSDEELEEMLATAQDVVDDLKYASAPTPVDSRSHEQVLVDEYEEGLF